jgi:glycosyltransferase involved in cell wall biosynthesis
VVLSAVRRAGAQEGDGHRLPVAGNSVTGKSQRTIAILANRGFAIANSRVPLISRMQEAGWRVLLITADDASARRLESLGATLETVPFYRGGLSVVRDFATLVRLIRLFARYRPELIHFFHAKPILLGGIAIAAVPGWRPKVVSTITGLGYAYLAGGLNWLVASIGYRLLVRRSNAVIFQNEDDRNIFVRNKWLGQEKAMLIVSSGVDTDRFRPESDRSVHKTVLMISRLIHQKGVQDYLDVARVVSASYPDTEFLLAGEIEAEHADRISEKTILQETARSGVRFLGFVSNVEELLSRTSVLVFPSWYREGLPRVVIEAAACAVPTIGADVPGTRDAIEDGTTGFLVPPRDQRQLQERLCQLLEDEELRGKMGRAARERVLAMFDVDRITARHLEVYRAVLKPGSLDTSGI